MVGCVHNFGILCTEVLYLLPIDSSQRIFYRNRFSILFPSANQIFSKERDRTEGWKEIRVAKQENKYLAELPWFISLWQREKILRGISSPWGLYSYPIIIWRKPPNNRVWGQVYISSFLWCDWGLNYMIHSAPSPIYFQGDGKKKENTLYQPIFLSLSFWDMYTGENSFLPGGVIDV